MIRSAAIRPFRRARAACTGATLAFIVIAATFVFGATPSADAEDRILLPPEWAQDPRNNIVDLYNDVDGQLAVDTSVKLTKIEGDTVTPLNVALVQTSCTDCQSAGGVLQLVLYERGASNVSPENGAFALNIQCVRCHTDALAIQFVLPVDDIDRVPGYIDDAMRWFEKKLAQVEKKPRSFEEATARIDEVGGWFQAFGDWLRAHPEALQTDGADDDDDDDRGSGDSKSDRDDD